MVSVIIPCYNHGKFLEETVHSVLNSSYEDVEIIIIDDGSVDDSRAIGENLSERFSSISYYYQKNSGPSVARNYGISLAKGEIILPLDADDLINSNYIEMAVRQLELDSDVKVVYALAEKFGAVHKPWKLKEFSRAKLAVDNMIYVSSFFRKKDWEEVGGFTENNVLVREDWEFWIKMLKNGGEVVRLPFVGFYYRIHDNSRRKSMSSKKKKNEIEYLNKQHADFFKEHLDGPLHHRRSWSRLINFFKK